LTECQIGKQANRELLDSGIYDLKPNSNGGVCLFKLVQEMCYFIEGMCCFTHMYATVTESARVKGKHN